jgi:hypothetical protein
LIEFPGIEKAQKEIEDGMKLSISMLNELSSAKSGIFSNNRLKNMKLANKIRYQNKLLLYKSCIIRAISKYPVDSIKKVYVQTDMKTHLNETDMKIIFNNGVTTYCSISIVQKAIILDFLKLFRTLHYLNTMKGLKMLFVISDVIEKNAFTILKYFKWSIEVKNLNR